MSANNSFMQQLEHKMKRARKMIDKVDDPVAYKAMDALFAVFDAMLSDATPTVVVMEQDGKLSELKPNQKVQTKTPETAGEKIAHHGQYL